MPRSADLPIPDPFDPVSLLELLGQANRVVMALDAAATITFINPAGAALLGYTPAELTGRNWFETCVPEDDREKARAVFEAAITGEDLPRRFESRVVTRSGEQVLFAWENTSTRDASGRLAATLGIGTDITERRRIERAHEWLTGLAEFTPDLVAAMQADGEILYLNRAGRELVGVRQDEPLKPYSFEQFHPSWAARVVVEEGIPWASEHGSWAGDTSFLRADGTEVPVSQVIVAHRDATGVLSYISTIARDTSAVTVAQRDVRRLNDELVETNRQLRTALEVEKGFLANMSHELRTPLNSIIGFTGIVRDGLAGPVNEEQHRQLDMVYHSSRRLLSLINDLLDLAKIESGRSAVEAREFELKSMIAPTVEALRPEADAKGIELTVHQPDERLILHQDCDKIEQILLNLIGNAIKYTNEGGVTVEVRVEGDDIIFEVEDTGIGIPPQHIPYLFNKFYQVWREDTAKPQGTGLGLSISLELAERLGGSLTAESDQGTRTRFTLCIPITFTAAS